MTNEKLCEIFQKNFDRVRIQASSAAEKGFAHLHEMAALIARMIREETGDADILRAVIRSDEAGRIYREAFLFEESEAHFALVNREEERFFKWQIEHFSRLYLCRSIAGSGKSHQASDLNTLFFGGSADIPSGNDRKIAFLRNHQAFRAFECFAKTLGGVSVLYENNFQNACEAVEMGQATYAIIPIYSTSDGRLNSFYRMIEKHELNIALTCDIDSDDGESMTTFALVYKERICLGGTPKFECTITFDELSEVSDITDAAYYYGARVEHLEALPVMFSGRAGTFAAVFDLSEADIDGLFCYLALEYPQMSMIGFYGKAERE